MIYSYGVTQQGQYHIKNNTVCQDAHSVRVINEHFAIGAVADGLGSEQYSDIASKIAVETSVDYCAEHIVETDTKDELLAKIKEAFRISLDKINRTAKEAENNVDQYDTTLSLVVYLNGDIYYGNAGDSGIVVLNQDGLYNSVTTQQRDENGCVFPLFFGEDKWEFGNENKVSSVFLATDGMYETLFPYLLRGEKETMYIALARYMMSNDCLNFSSSASDEVQKRMEDFIMSIPGDQVSDDKTVLVMIDSTIVPAKQPDDYYLSPDWVALKKKRDEEYKREAYPHLFTDDNTTTNKIV